MAQAQAPQVVPAQKEGSRWLFAKPSGEDLASWFKESVELHDDLDHGKYVGGIVMIPQKEKISETRVASDGTYQIVETGEVLTFTPYVKVETRVAYFWDYMDGHPEWVACIEPMPVAHLRSEGYTNENLPAGFFRMPVKDGSKVWNFLGCSMQVSIWKDVRPGQLAQSQKRATGWREPAPVDFGTLVRRYPAGTKIVSLVNSYNKADPNSIMKAETGAVGRALGMAGMLVIPGSGVATAEDMQEPSPGAGQQQEAALPPAAESAEPVPADAEPDVRDRINAGLATLESEHREQYDKIEEWAKGRSIDLADIKETQLRGVLRQVERALEAAASDD